MDTRKSRKLKDKAALYMAKERYSKALNIYKELHQDEPKDVMLMLKVGELSRLVGQSQTAVDVYSRAAEHYARDGMLLRGIAVCKVILDIDPSHTATQEQLAELYSKKYGAPLKKKPKPEKSPDEADVGAPRSSEVAEEEIDEMEIEVDLSEVHEEGEDEIVMAGEEAEADIEFAPPTSEPEELPYIPLFSDLDRNSFIELLNRVPVHRFDAGEQMVKEGDKGESFFVVVSGAVQVVKKTELELATLGPGTFFGEMALVAPRPRRASVETIEPSEILEISRQELDRLADRFPHILEVLQNFTEQRLLHNLMLTSPLFSPFSQDDRKGLMQHFLSQSFNEGQTIIKQGQDGHGLYLIVSGSVEVVRETDSTEEQPISKLFEGEIFGEIAMLKRSEACATVRAVQNIRLLCLPREIFNEIIMTHPQILILVSELSDERQHSTDELLKRDLASDLEEGSALL